MHGTSLGSCVDVDRHDAGSFVDRFASVDAQRLAVGGDEPASCRTDPPGDAVGKARCECCAEDGEVDVVRAEAGLNIGPSGELPARSRTVRNARPSAASWWASGSVTRRTRSASSTGRSTGRPRSTSRSSRTAAITREPGVTGVDDHPGETRVYRQLRHTTAEIGGSTGVVERTEGRQEFDRLRPACGVGCGEEGQGCRIDDCSASEVEGDRCHVVLGDGGWGVGWSGACSAFDQSRIATPGPRRPARPARWSADARLQLIVCRPLIPVRGRVEPCVRGAVDDGGNAVDREGGFGDVRRKNDSALGPGDEGGVLLSRRQAAVKGSTAGPSGPRAAVSSRSTVRISPTPGRKTSTSPGPRSASRTARTTAGASGSLRFWAARRAQSDRCGRGWTRRAHRRDVRR